MILIISAIAASSTPSQAMSLLLAAVMLMPIMILVWFRQFLLAHFNAMVAYVQQHIVTLVCVRKQRHSSFENTCYLFLNWLLEGCLTSAVQISNLASAM